ncbi:hypothetical protein L1280_001482 [Deinococcus sp. HSC-46F16]|uniref:DUF4279 domain-containing protein n=1 Tax=Deinococcus sp. HSC-46F16 TaxID=2910968 RepID=UPI00209D00C2|nr:DUF4279 domain-containing protein [Deinococcus sp. HSC-46F16]MCP2014345.1 hypothetical protein [Deinococcus sp. HSC-46F16]
MENESQPLVRVYLSVTGDFDPLNFSELVGLRADRTARRGERDGARVVPRCDSWDLEMAERRTWDMEGVVDDLLARLAGHEAQINAVTRAHDLGVVLRIVAYWNPAESSAPAVTLSVQQIACLARLGAFLDVDLYAS